ncbi:MAG: phosphate ABC transporter permease subunit PstC [Chloroflexota bacterium]|nr:phosphate ABC transporter permease subunit PstC [Dehalococcoidia bacterium]MDW8254580.1 phosphate ABC transporter permease subunit PstC [Chloroflexota bacterium]
MQSTGVLGREWYPPRASLAGTAQRRLTEGSVRTILASAAGVAILVTFGIVFALAFDAIEFFRRVPLTAFFLDTVWTPLFADKRFGIWALVSATVLTSLIALALSLPLGLIIAIFLSEFAPPQVRDVLKPTLEVLAGIPTVVYGYFALTFITPLIQDWFLNAFGIEVSTFNALSAGFVMGIMIIPLVSSLSEDALSAVPNALREGAYGLGATRFEVAWRVVVPAALSGIVASCILALSRAVGETMIVAIAAGQNPTFTFNPFVPVATMTAYIVQVSLGDTPYGSLEYFTLFAVGATLFVLTFFMNMASFWFVRRFREEYD